MSATNSTPAYEPPPNGFRTFVIVWATQSISVLGSALTFFATTIWLTQVLYPRPEDKPQLALALSAVALVFALPTVFAAPLAGAWADRHDRKQTMMAMDFANGVVSLVIALLILTNVMQLWMLLALTVVYSLLGAFHNSAFDTSYAMLVPEAQLPRANGMMQTIWSLSGIVSPAIAAMLISLPQLARQGLIPGGAGGWLAGIRDGSPLAIGMDGVTFFLAAATLIFLYIPSPKRTDLHAESGKGKSIWADIKEGGLYIWHRRPLLWLLGTFTVANLVSSPIGIFVPLMLKFNLQPDWAARGFTFETALALMSSIGAVGGVAGGFLISAWGGLKKKRVYGVLGGMIVAGLAQIIFGFSPLFFLTAAMMGVLEGMTPVMNAHSQAIWQTQTPRELQGRVFAVRRVIAQFTWPLSTAVAGWVAGVFNPGTVVAILGVVLVVFCVAQLFNPYLLRVEDKEWLDARAVALGE
ncbi:MAG: MFS transporter [Anaerolineae bacterium]